ncbi:hypothetical protein EV356DRAFT_503130 [Viridothelium virens]|uniref:Chitin-binding type-4 domain-containing protein n=1 Tax=Viridothelium virens TaxID=1048519 RepID=A0A6A6H7A1_VIRVR|nr:hypothetical protein EV356DRAFT_503130 [Viridothelium virens]
MKQTSTVLSVAGLVSMVSAHGFITSPQARMPGTAMQAACGQQVYNNQAADNYGNIQGELQVAASQSDYNAASCDITLCKGYKYADNTKNVFSYTAGQVIPIKFDVRAPHTGVANVSIVNTKTNTVIGSPLKSWATFASNSAPIPAEDTSFSITMPDVSSECGTAGACVIQHWWNAASIDQTYESCLDFTMGSGSGSGSGSAGSSSAAAAPASSSVSSAAAVVSSTATSAAATSAAATSAAASVTSVPAISSSLPAAVSSLTQAIPTSLLTSVIPTAAPTGASSGSGSVPAPSSPLPEGFTIQDLMDWLAYIMSDVVKDLGGSTKKSRKYARDFRM